MVVISLTFNGGRNEPECVGKQKRTNSKVRRWDSSTSGAIKVALRRYSSRGRADGGQKTMNNEPDPRGKSRSGRGFRQRRMQMAAGAIFLWSGIAKMWVTCRRFIRALRQGRTWKKNDQPEYYRKNNNAGRSSWTGAWLSTEIEITSMLLLQSSKKREIERKEILVLFLFSWGAWNSWMHNKETTSYTGLSLADGDTRHCRPMTDSIIGSIPSLRYRIRWIRF